MLGIIALTPTLLSLTGCRVAVIVVEGGEVQSTISGTCLPAAPGITGTVCIHEVNNTAYSETFTTDPDAGWVFVKWNIGDGFLCADSTNPTCVVTNAPLAGNPGVEAAVQSDAAFYLMPVFTEVGLPITDTVMVDDKEWAQADLFTNLSWYEINAVCPEQICDGQLNGYDMSGWASVEDVHALFNYYVGYTALRGNSHSFSEAGSLWAPEYYSDGWRPTPPFSTEYRLTSDWHGELVVVLKHGHPL
jgi:hypothetical protein